MIEVKLDISLNTLNNILDYINLDLKIILCMMKSQFMFSTY